MYSWTVLVTPTTEASITKTRPPCQWQGGLFVVPTPCAIPQKPANPHGSKVFRPLRRAIFGAGSGVGTWNSQGCVVVLAVPARSHPWEFPPLLLLYRSDPGSFSPSGFRRRPRWGQLKPSGALPVGGDFIAQQETPVKGAAHGFAATPLTGISRCAFCESPTEQIAQRACSRHEPTRWGKRQKENPVRAHLYTTVGGFVRPRFPRRAQYTLSQIWRFAKGLLRPKFSARLKH